MQFKINQRLQIFQRLKIAKFAQLKILLTFEKFTRADSSQTAREIYYDYLYRLYATHFRYHD